MAHHCFPSCTTLTIAPTSLVHRLRFFLLSHSDEIFLSQLPSHLPLLPSAHVFLLSLLPTELEREKNSGGVDIATSMDINPTYEMTRHIRQARQTIDMCIYKLSDKSILRELRKVCLRPLLSCLS